MASGKTISTPQKGGDILEAAFTVFARKGYGEATIPDIAAEANVAVGTIYNYYQSKKELLMSIVTTYIVNEPLLKLLKDPPTGDDRAFLTAISELPLRAGQDDRTSLIMSEVRRHPELRRQYVDQVLNPSLAMLQDYLQSRVDAGIFRKTNVVVAARALWGMMIGLLMLGSMEEAESPYSMLAPETVSEELVELVLNGLKK